jgi:hypothetical protein
VTWQKAILSSHGLEKSVPQALTSPNQVSNATPPTPSQEELNEYIKKLSKTQNQEFPLLTEALPETMPDTTILVKEIPKDTKPFQNAIQWMNSQLSDAHKTLDVALKGFALPKEGFSLPKEGFQDSCENLSHCLVNNPDFIDELTKAQKDANAKKKEKDATEMKKEILRRLTMFNADKALAKSLEENQTLVKKSEDIQKQAQSGELFKQIQIPGVTDAAGPSYLMPKGGDALEQLKKSDPDTYQSYAVNQKPFFAMKQLFEQINRTVTK